MGLFIFTEDLLQIRVYRTNTNNPISSIEMRILYTLFLTAMVAIAMERCRGKYLLVAVEDDDDFRKPKNDDDFRKPENDDLRAENSRGCYDCKFGHQICCKFDNGTERCEHAENCPTYGKDNRVSSTNPGIECCNYYNVDPTCFAHCQQLDIPVNRTEESSRFIPCIEWSHVIRRCRNGWSEWKLDKCCKKDGVSNKCRPLMCYGECKNKPWVLVGEGTGDQECDQHIEDVSSCCGAN